MTLHQHGGQERLASANQLIISLIHCSSIKCQRAHSHTGEQHVVPEHAAHEQQVLWDLCWVEEGWAVGAKAGQEGPGSPGAVLAGSTQPEAPQVGTGPLPETQGGDQLRSQG